MCWLYEIDYKGCFDWFDGSCGDSDDSLTTLLKRYGVDIVDFREFRARVNEFLTSMHEDGIIKPDDDLKPPTEEDIKRWFKGYKRIDSDKAYKEWKEKDK